MPAYLKKTTTEKKMLQPLVVRYLEIKFLIFREKSGICDQNISKSVIINKPIGRRDFENN
jgi:hypothetical protein